jgi:hypothetical protein
VKLGVQTYQLVTFVCATGSLITWCVDMFSVAHGLLPSHDPTHARVTSHVLQWRLQHLHTTSSKTAVCAKTVQPLFEQKNPGTS